ncbi:SH3 domain-containing protein [Streptomyces sp. NPDC001633]|uniref:SH3 domain-containing protein n=1 Tax=Streptomyces sp. NPDC001633 TaxID=3364595 RepID=UPI0036C00551
MRARRLSVLAATAAAIALPVISAPAATAAPATHAAVASVNCHKEGPWKIGTSAVRIHSKPSSKSTVLGVLYKGHKWSHGKTHGSWVHVKDKTTGVSGWVSMRYVYPVIYTCLD